MKGAKPRYPIEGWAFYEKCLSGTLDEELSHWRTVYQTSFLLFHHLKGESYPTLKYLQQKLTEGQRQRVLNDLLRLGFLVVLLFGSPLNPLPHSPVSKPNGRLTGRLRKRDILVTGERGGGGGGAQSYDGRKARPL
jgi:hypothetical protein